MFAGRPGLLEQFQPDKIMFTARDNSPPVAMLVGLGNPGPKYHETRHNIGFMAIDALLRKLEDAFPGCSEKLLKPKGCYELWRTRVFNKTWLLVKPLTFMNLSGEAVAPLAGFYKLDSRDVLVVHDELDLPLGRMKFKRGGGLAGHNGLKSLEACMGSSDFIRLRMGIDKPQQQEQMVNYVTSRFRPEETVIVEKILPSAVSALLLYMESGLTQAMQEANAVNFAPVQEKPLE